MTRDNEAAAGHSKGTDARLVVRARRGDAAAWAELVDQYSGYVFTLLRSTRVPESDQADAFQHVFVELFKALPLLRNIDHLAPWIRVTTLRHAVYLRRSAEKLPGSLEDDEATLFADTDIVRALEDAETAQTVREAIAGLKDRCRTLIFGLFFADPPLPYSEVARSLGLTLASMSMSRQRCLDALEKVLISKGVK